MSRYRQILQSATEFAVIVTDRNGIVTEWNTGAERILGWTADEMIGQSAEAIFTPEDRQIGQVHKEMATALAEGRGIDERWHLKADSSRFWASGEMMPLREEDDTHIGFVKILRDRTEQHQVGQALAESRQALEASEFKWRGLFENLQEGFVLGKVVRDGVGRIVDWRYEEVNRAWYELTGVGSGSTVGRTIREMFPGVEDEWVDEFASTVETGKALRFTRQVGTLGRWYEGVCQPVDDERFTAIFSEVTDRVIADKVLRETEERLRLASRATNDAIWDWNFATNHVLWNEALTTAYGHTPTTVEPTGEWWIGHIHPDDRERIDASIHAVIDGAGTDWADEYRFLRADGTYADVFDRGHIIRDEIGCPLRMIGAMLDLTRIKQIEADLRVSQEQLVVERGLLRAVFQQAPLGISIAYADGRGEINDRMQQMTGHDVGRNGDERYEDFGAFHPDGRPYAVTDYPTIRALRNGETLIAEPMTYRNIQTGESRRWELSSTPVRDESGEILASVTLAVDVEDRRQAEEHRATLNGELAHRLKNTLALVSSIITQTLRTAPDVASARKTLTDRIQALSKAHDILLTGQRDAGTIAEIVRAATNLHDEGSRLQLTGPIVVLGPKASLTLALIIHELATNASKYGALSAPEGRVLVSWSTDENPRTDTRDLTFEWRETGGPLVVPPTRKSFGTRLIEMGLSGASESVTDLCYAPEGVICKLTASLTELQTPE